MTPSKSTKPVLPAERPSTNRPTAEARTKPAVSTILEFEILTSQQANPAAQQWGKVFEKLGHKVSIRSGNEESRPSVVERPRGSLRFVTATALLNRQGGLSFGRKTFAMSETDKLAEWMEELLAYGAQGSPEGEPLWGLNRAQFEELYALLSKPLPVSTAGMEIGQLIDTLRSDHQIPIRLHTTMESKLDAAQGLTVLTSILEGFTTGTGLAAALNEQDAGFRPTRTPAGKVELEVRPLDQLKDPWPIGWEPKEETPRHLITPAIFKTNPIIELEDAPLGDVLVAIAAETKTPIVIDEPRCRAKNVDVRTKTISYPLKKHTAWVMVISSSVRKVGLDYQIRQDEAGRGFVLVTPFVPKAAETPK